MATGKKVARGDEFGSEINIHSDKPSSHPYLGETVYFGTMHDKVFAVQGALNKIGLKCEALAIDTDQFGTFSGEIERKGSVLETLRKKIAAVYSEKPEARLAMASEGSFGPHPLIGLIPSDHEALLLKDQKLGIEIYVEEISMDTNLSEMEFGPRDSLQEFLDRVGFPDHAIIVKPKGGDGVVYKGLQTRYQVGQSMIDGFMASPESKVILTTDMRANFNPTRMKVIEKTAVKLANRLTSFCPSCSLLGFWPSKALAGLRCKGCGMETQVIKELGWTCLGCSYEENRPRSDGRLDVDPSECEFCNP